MVDASTHSTAAVRKEGTTTDQSGMAAAPFLDSDESDPGPGQLFIQFLYERGDALQSLPQCPPCRVQLLFRFVQLATKSPLSYPDPAELLPHVRRHLEGDTCRLVETCSVHDCLPRLRRRKERHLPVLVQCDLVTAACRMGMARAPLAGHLGLHHHDNLLEVRMNWRRLDLNLLVVFDAVAQEHSATRAAAKLNMTQPAISHALARLRGALRDELFVRTPDGMEPTPYAERLAGPVHAALENLHTALDGAAAFDPATAECGFSVAVDNRAALVLAAPLAAAVAAEAPGVSLNLRPSGTLELAERLDRGELDLALGGLAAPGERFSDLRLFEDEFAALVRDGHPAAVDGTVGLDALGAYPQLALSSTGEETAFVDAELARHGLARRIALRAPLLAAPAALAQSDMIAVVGERTARAFARAAPLQVLRLPFASPRLLSAMLWHRRLDDMPAHRWLRGMVLRVARTL
jgi:DNA-binding transcriptional LysR family regulator